jgi:phosphohistidine swiveling domain-containing protein
MPESDLHLVWTPKSREAPVNAALILTSTSPADDVAARAGGKGANLWRLQSRGAKVPPFFIVAVDAFELFLRETGLDLEALMATGAAAVRSAVAEAPMPAAVDAAVRAALSSLPLPVAVRSSALAEDSRLHSFAGQLQTFLYVENGDEVVKATQKCWASAFSDHAVAYMRQHSMDPALARVAVVIQTMVNAEVAGVCFTVDPIAGDPGVVVVSSVYGLGEGLVSGLLDSDDVHVDKSTRAIGTRQVAAKDKKLVRRPGGGLVEVDVTDEERARPSLSDAGVATLVEAALVIERGYGAPQDIEWAMSGGELFILQARPVTTPLQGQKPVHIWDNSNIIESYFGVTSPLTFTFARNAYHHVYVQFCEVMGVHQNAIDASDEVFENMLGYHDGHIYYNLMNWYHLIGLFPGFKHNKSYMEGMMGVRESLPKDAQSLLVLPEAATVGERTSQALLGLKMAGRYFRLDSIVDEFKTTFDRHYADWNKVQFSGKPFEELLLTMRELENLFLAEWKAPIINDFFAMMAFGTLRKLVQDWGLDAGGTLQNDLLCGEGGVESAVPTELLINMALAVNQNPVQRTALASQPVADLKRLVEQDARFVDLKASIATYVDRYGFRCMNELKLEEPDLHTNPDFIFQALKNYVANPPKSVAELRAHEQGIRQRAEAVVRAKLSGVRLRVFLWVLAQARKTVKNRENLRLCRTKVFGLARRIFDGVGENLAARGVIHDARDVYLIERPELLSMILASATTTDWKGVVAVRKAARARHLASPPPPDRFVTRGAVALSAAKKKVAVAAKDGRLTGTGCCPGQVRALAKVIRDPRGDLSLQGQILVAERTDPGWTPLFPSACGVLVERGSLLSHSAIVARELGIPCVVGIAGLLATIKSGDDVQMDGGEGWARIQGSTEAIDATKVVA